MPKNTLTSKQQLLLGLEQRSRGTILGRGLLAVRADGAAQPSKQGAGLRALPGRWGVSRSGEDGQFALGAVWLGERSRGEGDRSWGTRQQGGCCPPRSWKLLPVLAEARSQVLSAWKPLSSLGLLPLLSTEEPEGRAWLAPMPCLSPC